MSDKMTPGPWMVQQLSSVALIRAPSLPSALAQAYNAADARAIGAVPDLIAALREILDCYCDEVRSVCRMCGTDLDQECPPTCCPMYLVRAALRKAGAL